MGRSRRLKKLLKGAGKRAVSIAKRAVSGALRRPSVSKASKAVAGFGVGAKLARVGGKAKKYGKIAAAIGGIVAVAGPAAKAASAIYQKVRGPKATRRGGTRMGRSRKRSPLWYAREITRLKLKKRYEKVKYSVR